MSARASYSTLFTTGEALGGHAIPQRVIHPNSSHFYPGHGRIMFYREKDIDPDVRLSRQYHDEADHIHECLFREPNAYFLVVASATTNKLHMYLVLRSSGVFPLTLMLIDWLRRMFTPEVAPLQLPPSFFAFPFCNMKTIPYFIRAWVKTQAEECMGVEESGLMPHQEQSIRFIRWRMQRPVISTDDVFAPLRLKDTQGSDCEINIVCPNPSTHSQTSQTISPLLPSFAILCDPPRHGKTMTSLCAMRDLQTVIVTTKPGVIPIWVSECKRLGYTYRLLSSLSDATAFCATFEPGDDKLVVIVSVFILTSLQKTPAFQTLWHQTQALVCDEFHLFNRNHSECVEAMFMEMDRPQQQAPVGYQQFRNLVQAGGTEHFLLLVSATPPPRPRFSQMYSWLLGRVPSVHDYFSTLLQSCTTLSTEMESVSTPHQDLLVSNPSIFNHPSDYRRMISNFNNRNHVEVPRRFKLSQIRLNGTFQFRTLDRQCHTIRFPPVTCYVNNPRYNTLRRVEIPTQMSASTETRFNTVFQSLRTLAEGAISPHIKMMPRLRRLCQHIGRMLADYHPVGEIIHMMENTEVVWRELTTRTNFRATGFFEQCMDSLPAGWTLLPNTTSCNICFSDFTDSSEVTALGCRHVFCRDCVGQWFAAHTTCPNCRGHVTYAHRTTFGQLQRPAEAEVPVQAPPSSPLHYNHNDMVCATNDAITSLVESDNQKWIVFFQRQESLSECKAHLVEDCPDIPVWEVSGNVSTARWHQNIEAWMGAERGTLLLTFAAGAEGVSLSCTRNIVLAEPPFLRSKFWQSIQRTKVFHTNTGNIVLLNGGVHVKCEWDLLLQ